MNPRFVLSILQSTGYSVRSPIQKLQGTVVLGDHAGERQLLLERPREILRAL